MSGNRRKIMGIMLPVMLLLTAILYPILIFNSSAPLLSTSHGAEGLSSMKDIISEKGEFVSILSSPTVLNDVPEVDNSAYMAIGIGRDLNAYEKEAVKSFMTRGGSVIISDDSTRGNELLSYLLEGSNASIAFTGHRMISTYNSGNPELPLVNATLYLQKENRMSKNTLVLNRPTSLVIGGDVRVIAGSNSSFVDYNDNGVVDADEKENAVIVAMAEAGMGRLVVISDPDIFINRMIYLRNNSDFLSDLMLYLLDGGEVYCDDSLHTLAFQIAGYTITATTSYPLDLMVTSILLIISYIAVLMVRDPEIWEHRFSLDIFINRERMKAETRKRLITEAKRMELAIEKNLTLDEAEKIINGAKSGKKEDN